ncbi:alpha/beta hydrolase-fold protein [Leptolyngbya sp. DQ-M1]|uniref:alpha/beta hydrolase n=1 Tax=Leptolyngbya sp. DQ-M1 TaxID=2933920 RepID=UPI00329948B1
MPRINSKLLKQSSSAAAGRLRARPIQPKGSGSPGLHPLKLAGKRDGLLYVPTAYRADSSNPLVLMLHGAGGNAENGLSIIQQWAEQLSAIVLAIDSREQTWDVILSHYGSDIAFIDQALSQTFSRYSINPNQIAIAGFSDGASYALSVGITNGDLFTDILAFSPGFITPATQVGQPRCFVSHGKGDTVLPIDRCSRRIVPRLQQAGYNVLYREFDGSHTVPSAIADEAMQWFTTQSVIPH